MNKIIERRFYWLNVKLISPLSINNGESINTDRDVLVGDDGIPFVPASSIAGAFRDYLRKVDENNIANKLFGSADNSLMSSISISDLKLNSSKIVIRDRVSLNPDSQVDNKMDLEVIEFFCRCFFSRCFYNKMDLEVIETGGEGDLFFNITIREEGITSNEIEHLISKILDGINNGGIHLGGIKNRGYGALAVSKSGMKSFKQENINDYLTFLKDIYNTSNYVDKINYLTNSTENVFETIEVNLKQVGGMIVRVNNWNKDEPDQIHIKSNDIPVIPGTSWNGPIRKNAKRILEELDFDVSRANQIIDDWFGTLGHKSLIRIEESVIENGTYVPIKRIAVSRFEAAVKTGAMLFEYPVFSGKTKLTIRIEKKDGYEAIMGLLYLVINDIGNGYISIGGEAGIGRGIFEFVDFKSDNYLEGKDEEISKLLSLYRKEVSANDNK